METSPALLGHFHLNCNNVIPLCLEQSGQDNNLFDVAKKLGKTSPKDEIRANI
jgi:hypothetical protein